MKKPIHFFALLIAMFILTTAAHPQKTVEVGGATMYPTKNIVENAVNSKDHTTLIAAVKAAGLVETLKSDGPFTVFAPTNKAFEKLPEGAVDNLLKPENKAILTSVLTYHVIAGRIDAAMLMQWIKKNNGTYTAKTVQGGELKFMLDKENHIWLMDEQGNKAMVTIKDVFQKNGVIHVIDTVLMPKM
jgi:uncharacterized surface protein with fasciclin (FAS1) repeats